MCCHPVRTKKFLFFSAIANNENRGRVAPHFVRPRRDRAVQLVAHHEERAALREKSATTSLNQLDLLNIRDFRPV